MDLATACEEARRDAVLFDLSDSYALLRISGDDRARFLQPLTANDIAALPVGHGQQNALLTKQSGITALFQVFRQEPELLLLAESEGMDPLAEALDFYHFGESVTFERDTASRLVALQGPRAAERLAEALALPAAPDYVPRRVLQADTITCLALSLTGDEGYVLIVPDDHPVPDALAARAAPAEALEILRIEAGQLRHGRDYDEETRILDAGLGPATINYDKGCFPGQEIVARIRSRGGETARRMMGLVIDGDAAPAAGSALRIEEKEVGTLRSTVESPRYGRIALAYLLKKFARETGKALVFAAGEQSFSARVVELPFYEGPGILRAAEAACAEGTAAYHDGAFEQAITHFEHALQIRPDLPDAMEGIGMCLERLERHDDAIRANRVYAERHPGALMAHTNLSRLYMLKGWKEKAEEEQARATMIKFQEAAGGSVDMAALEKQRKAQAAAERERKTALFTQVLEIDPEDEVANFGMGSVLVEAESFAEAVPYLERTVAGNSEYSAAFELLSRALAGSGETERAREILARGIEVAARRGDLMPLKAMEGRLAEMGEE